MRSEVFSRVKKIGFCLLVFACLLLAQRAVAGEFVRLIFIGDIMAHKEQLEAAQRGTSWDFTPQFRRIKPLFSDALVVGNLETVFAGKDKTYTGYPQFNTPDELADAVKDAGVQIVTLANNHMLDRREAGIARTIEVLDNAGIFWTGLGNETLGINEPLVVEYKGIRLAFVNYTYGSNNPHSANPTSEDVKLNIISDNLVEEGLMRAKDYEPDIIVACFHWGNEYQFTPTARVKALADLCHKNGADIVIGTHPHVLQPIEIVSSDKVWGLTAYSLGNFVSNQRTLPRERSLILAVDLEKIPEQKTRLSWVGIAPTWVSSTRPAGHRRFEVVYAGMGGSFNHSGLPKTELNKARAAGKSVLEFIGAPVSPDMEAFYTIWDSTSPDVLPTPRRKSPM
jgi:poly-gamma-glutamate synthesis protein (capsule biosynthesis protein)